MLICFLFLSLSFRTLAINGPSTIGAGCSDPCWVCCCFAIPVVGWCWLCSRQELIPQGRFGFVVDNGKPILLPPGRHSLADPLKADFKSFDAGQDIIQYGPISIIRVESGSYGFAWNNGLPEVLLPGRHVRTSASFKFASTQLLSSDIIQFGPLKFITVRSGGVQACYNKGKIEILTEGRVAVNSPTFEISSRISTQQQSVRLESHSVLLAGGVGMLIQGLLTFQVSDVEQLIHSLGTADLSHSVLNATASEISREMCSIHLEQLTSSSYGSAPDQKEGPGTKPMSVLGDSEPSQWGEPDATRSLLCKQVKQALQPIFGSWGITIINFQLEEINLKDAKYAAEYEQATLQVSFGVI